MSKQLETAAAVLRNPGASLDALRLAGEAALNCVKLLDREAEEAPQHEAAILAALTTHSIDETISALGRHDDDAISRVWGRKIAVALGAALDGRVRELEAIEAAKPAEQRQREEEAAERAARLEVLFAKVPVLFRSDFLVSKYGAIAYSHTPPPQGRQVSYARTFDVPRVLANEMRSTRLLGHWPPKNGEYFLLEQTYCAWDEDESIVAPIQALSQRSSVSDQEVSAAIELAQVRILKEFATTCIAIRSQYPGGELPRQIALPNIAAPRAMAAAE